RRDLIDRADYVIVVQQRLSHAHEDNIGKRPAEKELRLLANGYHLVVYLVDGQVPHPCEAGGSAEPAIEAATHLGGNARRNALCVGNEDGLHYQAVMQADSVLYRSVGTALHFVNMQDLKGKMVFQ